MTAGNAVGSRRRRRLLGLALCLGLAESAHLRRAVRAGAGLPTEAIEDDVRAVEELAAELPQGLGRWGEKVDGPVAVVRDEGVLSGVGDPAKDALNKIKNEWHKGQEKLREELGKARPLLNKINVMRADMCWERKDLWDHEQCVKFLGIMCSKGSTGHGTCHNFLKSVEEHCKHPSNSIEGKMCDFFKKLGLPVDDVEALPAEDLDGDGHQGEGDLFPEDPKEWEDVDQDGIGDNSDSEVSSKVATDRETKVDISSSSGSGGKDTDGDGVEDSKDAFPEDPKEWGDLDQDGLGDNADEDLDGDGVANELDEDDRDPSKGLRDSDGDGVPDEDDAFPSDPAESKDTDGDGIGDNADAYPEDPRCTTKPCRSRSGADGFHHTWPEGKAERGLPPDGYDEYTPGKVEHDDMETETSDWRKEWPRHHASNDDALKTICAENPESEWCKQNGHHAA